MLVAVIGGSQTKNVPPAGTGNASISDPKTAQEDFERVNPKFIGAVLPCQIGFTAAGKAIHAGNRYGAYDIVEKAKQACVGAWEDANATKYSEAMPEPFRDKLNADLDDCSHAYAQDGGTLITISAILNGDTRPSTVSSAVRGIQMASSAVTTCMTTYTADLKAAGVKLPGELKAKRKQKHLNVS